MDVEADDHAAPELGQDRLRSHVEVAGPVELPLHRLRDGDDGQDHGLGLPVARDLVEQRPAALDHLRGGHRSGARDRRVPRRGPRRQSPVAGPRRVLDHALRRLGGRLVLTGRGVEAAREPPRPRQPGLVAGRLEHAAACGRFLQGARRWPPVSSSSAYSEMPSRPSLPGPAAGRPPMTSASAMAPSRTVVASVKSPASRRTSPSSTWARCAPGRRRRAGRSPGAAGSRPRAGRPGRTPGGPASQLRGGARRDGPAIGVELASSRR